MNHEKNIKPKYDGNTQLTVYIPKSQILQLAKAKNIIFEEYNIRMPLSEFFRDALTIFIDSKFQQDRTLKENLKSYLKNKELI